MRGVAASHEHLVGRLLNFGGQCDFPTIGGWPMSESSRRVFLGQIGSAAMAIPGFRRIHLTAILINLAQLVLIVWSLIALSIQMK